MIRGMIADIFKSFLPLIITLAIVIILSLCVLRPYIRFLSNRYGYNLLGIPSLLLVLVYAIMFLAAGIGEDSVGIFGNENDWDGVFKILLIGAPFLLIIAINAMIKTKNILIAITTPIIMFVFAFFASYFGAGIILFVALVFISALMFGRRSKRVCANCGKRLGPTEQYCSRCN